MPKKTFRGGIHPLKHEGKGATRDVPIVDFTPDTVVIPMAMHLGAPSVPCVTKGERVLMGQKIADEQGFLGLPIHASISGTVQAVETRQQLGAAPVMCVEIQNDFQNEMVELTPTADVELVDPSTVVSSIKAAGICGMGGAAFPTHVKLTVPEGKSCDTIIVNGAECETHLTSDYRLMVEEPEKVVNGLRAVMRALSVDRGVICIEDNKPEAIQAIITAATSRPGVEILTLRTKYPQGSEKQLIKAATGREVQRGALPIDAHTIVLNTATCAAIADSVIYGIPLISRITTVTGCVKKPSNIRVPIGSIVADVIGACDGYSSEFEKIIMGGAMTGPCAPTEHVSITKGAGGIIVVDKNSAKRMKESSCIRCARCVEVCPMGLNPYMIKAACDSGDAKLADSYHVMDCIVCGCCSFICPANRYLTPSFKIMKEKIAAAARK